MKRNKIVHKMSRCCITYTNPSVLCIKNFRSFFFPIKLKLEHFLLKLVRPRQSLKSTRSSGT